MSNRRRLAVAGPPVLLRPGMTGPTAGNIVRNVATERILPCCHDDCTANGDNRIQIQVPHERPRWRKKDGTQEMLIYIFCTEQHKEMYRAALQRG